MVESPVVSLGQVTFFVVTFFSYFLEDPQIFQNILPLEKPHHPSCSYLFYMRSKVSTRGGFTSHSTPGIFEGAWRHIW
jgi:hypothetical protein